MEKGLRGESLASFRLGRYRSMVYVDVGDVLGLLGLMLRVSRGDGREGGW